MHTKHKAKQTCASGETRKLPFYVTFACVRSKALYPCMCHNLLEKSESPTSACYRSFYAPGIVMTMLPGCCFDLPSFLGHLDEGIFPGSRTDCKPRANNSHFWGVNGALLGRC